MRLQVAADPARSKHIGDARNGGKSGPLVARARMILGLSIALFSALGT